MSRRLRLWYAQKIPILRKCYYWIVLIDFACAFQVDPTPCCIPSWINHKPFWARTWWINLIRKLLILPGSCFWGRLSCQWFPRLLGCPVFRCDHSPYTLQGHQALASCERILQHVWRHFHWSDHCWRLTCYLSYQLKVALSQRAWRCTRKSSESNRKTCCPTPYSLLLLTRCSGTVASCFCLSQPVTPSVMRCRAAPGSPRTSQPSSWWPLN